MTRLSDWETALGRYLGSVEREPFAFGTHDCALFSANAVLAMTGEDPASEFRGKYRSQAGAVRAVRQAGYDDLAAVMDTKFPTVEIGYAKRGDVVMHDGSLGIVMGGFAVFVGGEEGADGLVRVSRAEWERAWSV